MADNANDPGKPDGAGPVSKLTAKAAREQYADLLQKAQAFAKDHADDQNLLSAEDQANFDQMVSDAFKLKDAAEQLEKREIVEDEVKGLRHPISRRTMPDPTATISDGLRSDNRNMITVRFGNDKKGNPFYTQVPAGSEFGNVAYRDMFTRYLQSGPRALAGEFASLQSDNAEQAGYLITSEQFASELLRDVDDLLFVRQHAKVHTLRGSKTLGIRARTAKAQTFNWSPELVVSDTDTSLKYGKRVLEPHHLTGDIEVSRDLLRNAVVSVEGEIRGEMARDSGEVMEDAYLTGHGSQQPLGVFTPSDDGIPTSRDVLTGSATGFTFDALVSAKYSLKSQYRKGGTRAGARWLFNRTALLKIALLKDGDGHPLLRPGRGLEGDDPDTILGIPFDESERAPGTFTSAQYVGLLAQWRYYEIADSLDMEMQVLFELKARQNQVVYIGRLKTDGMPTLAEAFVRLKTNT